MKIFLTGADGMLGDSFLKLALNKSHTVFACSHSQNIDPYKKIDIKDFLKVRENIKEFNPDIIVHLAALTNVDYCEVHPQEAFLINTDATKNLLDIASKHSIPIVFISTGAVFEGSSNKPYKEEDYSNAINMYGKSKLKAEEYLKKYRNHLIIRTGWLIGGIERDKKFVGKILQQIKNGSKELFAVSDIYGSPTLTDDLAKVLLKLIQKDARGTLHVVNSGIASRYEIAKEVLQLTGKIKSLKLRSVKFGYFHETAPRPKMEALDSSYILKRYNIKLGSWKKALKKYLRKLGK